MQILQDKEAKLNKFVLLASAYLIYGTKFDLKNARVYFVDGATGTGKPNKLEIRVGDGNIEFDEKKVREYNKDRGKLYDVRDGDEEPMEVNIDIIWEHIKAGSGESVTPEDFLKFKNGASAYVSTDSNKCRPKCIDIWIVYDPQCATEQIEKIVLPEFRYEGLNHNAKTGMLKLSGKCNATEATITRTAQT